MAQPIKIKRRIPGTGKPAAGTGANQVTAGELAASISAVAATAVADLYIGDGSFVHDLVSAARQVEINGAQTINGAKTIAVTNLHITGGDDGDLLATDGTGVLEWVPPPKGVESGATAPAAPHTVGDTWYNTSNNTLMIWNGSDWEAVNGVWIQAAAPTGIPEGTFWLNSNTHVLSVYNGTTWVSGSGARSYYDAPGPPAGTHVAGDIWWSPAGPQYHNGTTWVTATLPGFTGVATEPPISGNGTSGNALGVTMATTTQINAGTNDVYPIDSAGLRTQLGDAIANLTTSNKTIVPAINELDSDIGTLSGQISALTGALRYVGNYDAADNEVASATAGTLTVGAALPAPAAGNHGWYVIVTEAGTGTAPAPTVRLEVGDWIVSTGAGGAWVHVPLYHAAITAANVAITQINAQTWNNVQAALGGLYTLANGKLTDVAVDGVSIIGDGTAGDPLEVGTIDGGTF